MTSDDTPLVFFSYASPDRDRVMPHYRFLKGRGFNVWIDKDKLLGGQQWDYEIRKALNKASVIIMFVSRNSINRRGYVQREIKIALTKLEEKLVSDIYVIPVLLDSDASRPEQLASIQFLDAEEDGFESNLISAVNHQLDEAQAASVALSDATDIVVSKSVIKEEWNGVPGYRFSGELPFFASSSYQNLSDITDVIRGFVKSSLLRTRRDCLDQGGDFFSFGHDRYRRTNTWDAFCADPIVQGRIMSIVYTVSWYGAGAAHPNMGYNVFNFLLDPLSAVSPLFDIFRGSSEALSIVQRSIFETLSTLTWGEGDSEEPLLLPDAIRDATKDWDSLLNYVFGEEGITFLFAPYQVGPYAAGPQSATVPYSDIMPFMIPLYRTALDIEHIGMPVPSWISATVSNGTKSA